MDNFSNKVQVFLDYFIHHDGYKTVLLGLRNTAEIAMLGLLIGIVFGTVIATGTPGEVLLAEGAGVIVACGEGALCVTELQKPGGKRLPAAEFLRGMPIAAGSRFD